MHLRHTNLSYFFSFLYHREFTGYDPMDPEHFDLMLNSSMLGVDGTAEMLADIARKRFAL